MTRLIETNNSKSTEAEETPSKESGSRTKNYLVREEWVAGAKVSATWEPCALTHRTPTISHNHAVRVFLDQQRLIQRQDNKSTLQERKINSELACLKDEVERLKNDNLNLFEAYYDMRRECGDLRSELKTTLQENNRLKIKNRILKHNRDCLQKQWNDLYKQTTDLRIPVLCPDKKNEIPVGLTIMAPMPKW